MKAHFRRKHEGKTFDCEQCDKQFSSAAAINNHVRAIRDKEKNWPCHTCNTKYPFQTGLYKHFQTQCHKKNEEKK